MLLSTCMYAATPTCWLHVCELLRKVARTLPPTTCRYSTTSTSCLQLQLVGVVVPVVSPRGVRVGVLVRVFGLPCGGCASSGVEVGLPPRGGWRGGRVDPPPLPPLTPLPLPLPLSWL